MFASVRKKIYTSTAATTVAMAENEEKQHGQRCVEVEANEENKTG